MSLGLLAAAVLGALLLAAAPATAGSTSNPALVLIGVTSKEPAVVAGRSLTLTVTVRNRSSRSRAGRLVVRLTATAAGASARVVARRTLRRLRGGRSTRLRVVAAIPRTLAGGRRRVVACVSSASQKGNCKQVKRLLRVLTAPATAPPAGSDTGLPADLVAGAPPPVASTAPPPEAPVPDTPASPVDRPVGTVFQTIDGFGASSRAFSDSHVFDVPGVAPPTSAAQQGQVLDALFLELGLTRIRPVQPDTGPGPPPVGIEIANDNSDPLSTDLTRFDFGGRRLDDHVPVVAGAKVRGAGVAWISPLNREPWMGVAPGTSDVAEYAEWLLAQVRRFSQRGGRLDYVSVANEPSYSRNTMSGEFIRDVIKELGPRLKAENLPDRFVVPDDVRASDAVGKAATVLADPDARQYVGALASHLYDEPLEKLEAMRALAQRYGLPLWMSEFSTGAMSSMRPSGSPAPTPLDWALLMHDLLATYDVSAVDYLWGYIGAGGADEVALLALDHDGTTYRGFTRTKVFYYFGQYSRFVRPGAQRIAVVSSNGDVRASAYHRDKARTVVAINPGATVATTTLTAPDLAGVSRFTQTRTSPTDNWATAPEVSVQGTSVTVTLPPQSVTTLSGTAG